MSEDFWQTIITAGIGVLTASLPVYLAAKFSTRGKPTAPTTDDTPRSSSVVSVNGDLARTVAALAERSDRQDETIARQGEELADLRSWKDTNAPRIDRLVKENRTLYGVLVGALDRLHQVPPLTPADVIQFIRESIPGIGKDPHHD